MATGRYLTSQAKTLGTDGQDSLFHKESFHNRSNLQCSFRLRDLVLFGETYPSRPTSLGYHVYNEDIIERLSNAIAMHSIVPAIVHATLTHSLRKKKESSKHNLMLQASSNHRHNTHIKAVSIINHCKPSQTSPSRTYHKSPS